MEKREIGATDTQNERPDETGIASLCIYYERAMNLLGKRWTGLIIRELLLRGPSRFNELLAAVPGLSDPLLTQRLRELETEGLVERHVFPTSPVRVEYRLTEAGRDLEGAIKELTLWAHRWFGALVRHEDESSSDSKVEGSHS